MPPRMSGYNILVRNTSRADLDRLKDHFRRNPPGIAVVFLEPNFITELQQVSPSTLYIFRDAPPGHGTDDEIYDKTDPVAFVNHLHNRAPAGAALYLGNEPFHLDRIAQWTLPALDRCDQVGRRGVVLNLSPGRPEPADWGSIFTPLLRRMNGTQHIMGLHEYFGRGKLFAPWWVGRAKFLYEACAQLGVTRPPIAYTEIGLLGLDDAGNLDPFGGWLKLGVSADEYADELIQCYRIWEQQDTVLGAAIFSVGTWNGCEVETSPRLLERLEQYQPMTQPTPDPVTPPTPTPPTTPGAPTPVPKPTDAGEGITARVTRTAAFEFINIRSGPNTNYEKRGEIRVGDTILYYPASRKQGGVYEWMYVIKTGAEGWFAFGLTTLETIAQPTPIPPTPVPPTPPVTPPVVTPPVVTPPTPQPGTVTLPPNAVNAVETALTQLRQLGTQMSDLSGQVERLRAQIKDLLDAHKQS